VREPVSGRLAYLRQHIQEIVQRTDFMQPYDSLRSALDKSSKNFMHDGVRVGLQDARINKGDHQRDDDNTLSCKELAFVRCDFFGCIFNNIDFSNCTFDLCSFDGAVFGGRTCFQSTRFKRCNFDRAILRAEFNDCIIELSPMARTDFSLARLTECRFDVVDLSDATFAYTTFAGIELRWSAGLSRLIGYNTPACPRPQDDAIEEPELPAIDRILAWDRLRAVGRLPIFSVSSAALVLSSIHLYAIATWNDAAERTNLGFAAAAERASALVSRLDASLPPDLPLRDAAMAVSIEVSETLRHLTGALFKLPLPGHAFWLFVGTVLLALGSSSYLLRCPPRIQRFSDVEWRDEIRGSPFHYAPLACSRRLSRICVATALALGGALTGFVALSKLWTTGWLILQHGGAPWPFN
jgi:hypothetical protein